MNRRSFFQRIFGGAAAAAAAPLALAAGKEDPPEKVPPLQACECGCCDCPESASITAANCITIEWSDGSGTHYKVVGPQLSLTPSPRHPRTIETPDVNDIFSRIR